MISIVTVVYNGAESVTRTFRSVALLSRDADLQYIIVDGGSSDGTIQVVEGLVDAVESDFTDFQFVSEPDEGLYDAMNKALEMVSGDYVLFLNAGDELVQSSSLILSSSSGFFSSGEDVIVFGVESRNSDGALVQSRCFGGPEDLWRAPAIPHQSTFVKTSLLKKLKFDLSYKILADYDQFCKLHSMAVRFKYVPEALSVFELGGVSNSWRSQKYFICEFARIQKKYFGRVNLLSVAYFFARFIYLFFSLSPRVDKLVRKIFVGKKM